MKGRTNKNWPRDWAELDAWMQDHAGAEHLRAWNAGAGNYRLFEDFGGFRVALIWMHEHMDMNFAPPAERLLMAMFGKHEVIAVKRDGTLTQANCMRANQNRLRRFVRAADDTRLKHWLKRRTWSAACTASIFQPASAFWSSRSAQVHGLLRILEQTFAETPPPAHETEYLVRILHKRVSAIARQAMGRVVRHLEASTVSWMRHCRAERSANVYNWLVAAEGISRQYRRQAVREFPFFSGMLAATSKMEGIALTSAVDTGKPLTNALAHALSVRPATIRRLRHLGARECRRIDWRLETVVRILDIVPFEYWPNSADAWKSMNSMVMEIPHSLWLKKAEALRIFRPVLRKVARRGWVAGMERYREQFHWTDGMRDMSDIWSSLDEITGRMRDSLEDRTDSGWTSPFGAMNFNQLREVNERWHQLLHEDAGVGGEAAWLPLSDAFRHGSRCIVPLTNESMLQEEGRSLQHCVASYVHRCLTQPVHIASVRDSAGRSCSTVEIHLVRKAYGWRPELAQHRGLRNRQPSPACRRAVRAWIRWMEELDARHWAELAHACMERQKEFMMGKIDPERIQRERRLLERALPADAWQVILAQFEGRRVSDEMIHPAVACEVD